MLAGFGTIQQVLYKDFSGSEIRTSNGLALSTDMAAMCAGDFVRTVEFLRGMHAAVIDVRERFPSRPARVLYAGCGPYATLAVPLMTVFSAAEATFTLLDIQPESIESARSVVNSLGLSGSVSGFEITDATQYLISPAALSDVVLPDIILIEIMQACLEAEPQVAVARNLIKQAPQAILVPEEVRISLAYADPLVEFDRTAPEKARKDRLTVGPVFIFNRDTVNKWSEDKSGRLVGAVVQIPLQIGERCQPILFTTIRTYRDHIISEYESGLTHPRIAAIEGSCRAGDRIQFYYEPGLHPRLSGKVFANDNG